VPSALSATIALTFGAPSLMTVVGELSNMIEKVIKWIDPSTFTELLSEDHLAGGDWARMAANAALWIALPAIGLVRLRRGDK
jgi:hypothetical protein